MMDNSYALAIDLGASGGKLFVGKLAGERAEIVPVHQFENRIINARGRSYWDFLHILHEIKAGYAKAQQEFGGGIRSIAIDSWCNDYALLSKNGAMLESPRNYRDKRTEGWVERAGGLLPRREVYQKTGQQFARFQTCYHLLAQKEEEPGLLELAASLLFIPDYLSYLLGAGRYTEYTVASVTNLFHITENRWDTDILDAYGLPRSIFMPIVQPGTKVGRVSGEVCAELKTPAADIYAVGSHDTACAVASAAVDSGEPFLFISSGTWSLVGVEIPAPILTEESLAAGFGNEGGVGGRIRYIKNVMGLWLLQECMRVWKAQGKDYSYARLAGQAEAAGTIGALIDPDDELYFEPRDMPQAIAGACARRGYTPQNDVEIVRVIAQSLACKYRYVAEQAERLTARRYDTLYLFGGGSNNDFLNQLTADVTGKTVLAGLPDATAAGNLLTQWMGRGLVPGLRAARRISKNSHTLKRFTPSGSLRTQEMYRAFLDILKD